MLGAIQIMINGVWSVLSISIPISDTISFTFWQYFFFLILFALLLKKLFAKSTGGGGSNT